MTHTSSFHQLRVLWDVMQGKRALYVGAILAVAAATVCSLAAPLVLRATIDSVIGDQSFMEAFSGIMQALGGKSVIARNLWICSLTLISLACAEAFFLYLKGKWSAIAAEATAQTIRDQVYDHVQHVSYEYLVKAETGDLVQRCTSDVETIRQFLAMQFVEVGRVALMIAATVPLMLRLHHTLTLVSMALIPIILGFAVIFFIKIEKAFQVSDEAEGRLSTILQENVTGVRVVRAFARQMFEIEKFDRQNVEFRDMTYKLIRLMACYWLASSFLGMLQFGSVLFLGTYWTAKGVISLGTLVVFLTYTERLLHPIRNMGRMLADMGKTVVSVRRIREILDQPTEYGGEQMVKPVIQGNITFRNVAFGYDPQKPVLNNLSFTVKQGQTVAILGATGSGKTALVHLLARLYDYQQGSVTIDGVELNRIEKKWLRQHVGLVLQEPFLFSKPIRENIALARPDATDAEITAVAHFAALHDVIMGFEQGYDTPVGEKGVTLSGGQKQRMAIARTLLRKTPILILDDSLSAVDTETDALIRHALRKRNHATTFIISHRITTLSEADLILVLNHGEIAQIGSHDDLIHQDGLYRKIWLIQNELEDELEQELVE